MRKFGRRVLNRRGRPGRGRTGRGRPGRGRRRFRSDPGSLRFRHHKTVPELFRERTQTQKPDVVHLVSPIKNRNFLKTLILYLISEK